MEGKPFIIDWELPRDDFKKQIKDMIKTCQKLNKVIPLPEHVVPGEAFLYQLATLTSQVNCEACDALCCKRDFSPDQKGIALLLSEVNFMRRLPSIRELLQGNHLPLPCPLLKNNRCIIYDSRPLACALFPWQPGEPGAEEGFSGVNLTLASACPEGRRIALSIYLRAWELKRQFSKATMGDLKNWEKELDKPF